MYATNNISPCYEYTCQILRFIDGDTVEISASWDWIGTIVSFNQHVRVDGINAPEIHSTNPIEKALGLASKAHAESLAPVGSVVKVRSANPLQQRDKYGRWLSSITLPDGRDFATTMIHDGFAVEYHGEKR